MSLKMRNKIKWTATANDWKTIKVLHRAAAAAAAALHRTLQIDSWAAAAAAAAYTWIG